MPQHITTRQLTELLRAVNQSRREGASIESLSAQLSEGFGFTYEELLEQVKAAPREEAAPAPTLGEKLLQVGQGATFGFLDEFVDLLSAGGGAVTGAPGPRTPRTPSEAGENIRETIARLREQDPGGSLATEMIGGVATGSLAARGIAGSGKSALGRLGAITGMGTAFGAAAGIGEGETLPERAVGGAFGGLFGGALSLLLGGGTEIARFAATKAGNKFFPKFVAGLASEAEIRTAAAAVGLTAREFKDQMTEALGRRPGLAAPIDVNRTRTFRGILEGATERASGSRQAQVDVLAARGAGARARIAKDIEELIPFGDIDVARNVARTRVDAVSKSLFAPVDNIPIPRGIAISKFPEPADDLARVLKGKAVARIWKGIRPDRPQEVQVRHVRELRSRLNSSASKAAQANDPAKARMLRREALELDTALEQLIPEFRAANRGYYRANRVVDAFARGVKASKDKLHDVRLQRELASIVEEAGDLGEEALQAFRHGALDFHVDALTKGPSTRPGQAATQVRELIEPGKVLRDIFESEGQLKEFVKRLWLEEGFTLMKNLSIESALTIDGTSSMLSFAQNAAVQGKTAAFYRVLNTADPNIANTMSDIIVDFLTTTGETNAQRLFQVLSRPQYDQFFRAIAAGNIAVQGRVGQQTTRGARELADPLRDLLERLQGRPADLTTVGR